MTLDEPLRIDARAQPQVDAREAPHALEQRLGARDVHRRDALVRGAGKLPGDAHAYLTEPDLQCQRIVARDAERRQCRRGQEDRVGPQHVEPVA